MKSFFYLFSIISISLSSQSWAFDWNELWQTSDQKAHVLMNKGQFAQAEATFDNPDWKALAAFRAGHYKKAASLYAQLKTNDYNQGNALARAGQLESAIQAYDKALANNPNDQDAIFNRKIVEELLKKQQKQNKDKQQKQSDKKSNDKTRDNQEQQEGKNKENQQDQKKPTDQQKKQEKNKKDIKSTSKSKQESNLSPEEQEQQQAKKQWLKLIPDDPGGLMREKFLRDYLRRQQR